MKSAQNSLRNVGIVALLCILVLLALTLLYSQQVYDQALSLVMKTTSSAAYPSGDAAEQLAALGHRLRNYTIFLCAAAVLGYVVLLSVIFRASKRMARQQQSHVEHLQEKELELSLAANRFEKMCRDLLDTGIVEQDFMHNHASLSNWLDSNYDLFTRRSSEAILGAQLSTALVLIEADNLMELNQNHGLEGGDAALNALSDLLKEHTRKNDIVARWQEGTFLVVLHDIALKNALGRVEELRADVEQMEIPMGAKVLHITITCGLSMMLDVDKSWKQTLSRAQRALARGREASKNTVCHEIFQ